MGSGARGEGVAVRFYGLADYSVQEVVEFYLTREQAEEALREVLADEPDWAGILEIVEVEIRPHLSPN